MKNISDKTDFFIFLLEKYTEFKNIYAKEALNLWNEKGIVD